jgi:spore germination protein GerM
MRFFKSLFGLVVVGLIIFVISAVYINNAISNTMQTELDIFFLKESKPVAVRRKVSLQDSVSDLKKAKLAMNYLLEGPNYYEKFLGYHSSVTKNMKVINISQDGYIMVVNLAKIFLKLPNYKDTITQMVYTLTDLPSISFVLFLIEGRREMILGDEGLIIDQPLARKDLKFTK